MGAHDDLVVMKRTMIQVASLAEVYDEIISSSGNEQKRLEAEYARDQILKLSMHLKHILQDVERKEAVK
ncbi:MAG: hypothetical protein ACE5DM_05290 [Candidatus Nanoarchaeia archaeon]